MARYVSLADVNTGVVSLMDLLKLNAFMDAQEAREADAAVREATK